MFLNATEDWGLLIGGQNINLEIWLKYSSEVQGLVINVVVVYTHSLTSSSSENTHELLSYVIILTPMAESASMLCVISAGWNTGTHSSARDSKMKRFCQRFMREIHRFTRKCTSAYFTVYRFTCPLPLWSMCLWLCVKKVHFQPFATGNA